MKKLLLILAIPVVLVIAGLLALVLLVNPNQFKPLIVEQTKAQTGLELVIDGDIGWSFFPSLGLTLGETALKNPEGFTAPNLLSVKEVGINVSVMPLFSKTLNIGNVNLDGASFNLETLKSGRSNIDAIIENRTQTSTQAEETTSTEVEVAEDAPQEEKANAMKDWNIALAGVSVSNVSLDIKDHKAGTHMQLHDVAFTLSEFAPNEWASVTFAAKGKNNQQNFTAKGSTNLKLSEDFKQYALKDIVLDASYSEPSIQIESASVKLTTMNNHGTDEWSSATFAVKGKSELNKQNFIAEGRTDLKLSADFKQYSLKDIVLDASYSDPSTKIDSANIKLTTFDFDKANDLSFDVKGKASDLTLDTKGTAKVTVNKAISLVKVDKVNLNANLNGKALPQNPMKVGLQSDISFDLNKNHLTLLLNKLTANTLTFDGNANVTLGDIPAIRFNLHSPNIDLDEFLGLTKTSSSSSSANTSTSSTGSANSAEVEPDLSALKTLDVKGAITVDAFKANNAKLQNTKMEFTINRGIINLTSLSSKLYQGSIQASARLDATKTPATYSAKKTLKGVHVLSLLKDVANTDVVEGIGNINIDVKGQSLTPTGIQNNLVGTANINFTDGSVKGTDLLYSLRSTYLMFKGRNAEAETMTKTTFDSLVATLNLNKGNVTSNNLSLQSPLLKVTGNGKANYINDTVDFSALVKIVGSLQGLSNKDSEELRNIDIPVKITGKLSAPSYKISNLESILKQKATQAIQDKVIPKLEEKLIPKLEEKIIPKVEDKLEKIGVDLKDDETKKAVGDLMNSLFN